MRTVGAIVAALGIAFACTAGAALVPEFGPVDRFEVEPIAPNSWTPLVLRIDLSQCIEIEPYLARQSLDGHVLTLGVWVSDVCNPKLGQRTQAYPLGLFAPGNVEVVYLLCALIPQPGAGDPCVEVGRESIVVHGAQAPVMIPTARWYSLLVACIALTFAARPKLT